MNTMDMSNKIDTTDRILQKVVPIIETEIVRLEQGGVETPPTKKEVINRLTVQLDRLYDLSDHPNHFHSLIRKVGLNVYENKNGLAKGVYHHGHKISFNKIGMSGSRYEALDRKFTRKLMDNSKTKTKVAREIKQSFTSPVGPQRAIESVGTFVERRIADLEQIANNKLDDYEREF